MPSLGECLRASRRANVGWPLELGFRSLGGIYQSQLESMSLLSPDSTQMNIPKPPSSQTSDDSNAEPILAAIDIQSGTIAATQLTEKRMLFDSAEEHRALYHIQTRKIS